MTVSVPEILNLEYNTARLVELALNKYDTKKEAAAALRITERCLFNYIDRFGIIEKKESAGKKSKYHFTKKLQFLHYCNVEV